MIVLKQKSDILGTLSSSLCLLHCIATPFIFIAQTSTSTLREATPLYWQFLDYFFLIISFFAIYWSSKTTSIRWIKPLLWLGWLSLLIVVLNEKIGLFPLAEAVVYIPAFVLVFLHLFNKKYCQCNKDKCCMKAL